MSVSLNSNVSRRNRRRFADLPLHMLDRFVCSVHSRDWWRRERDFAQQSLACESLAKVGGTLLSKFERMAISGSRLTSTIFTTDILIPRAWQKSNLQSLEIAEYHILLILLYLPGYVKRNCVVQSNSEMHSSAKPPSVEVTAMIARHPLLPVFAFAPASSRKLRDGS